MKKIIIILTLLLISFPVYAISGCISLDYNTIKNTGTGKINLYEDIGKFKIGGILTTDLMGFNLKDGYFFCRSTESADL